MTARRSPTFKNRNPRKNTQHCVHYRYWCSRCGDGPTQCRCLGPRTDVTVDGCPRCAGKPFPKPLMVCKNPGDEAQLPSPRRESLLPALPPQALPVGQWTPPRVSWELMTSGRQPFVYMPESAYEHPPVTTALERVLTRAGVVDINRWEDLIAACGHRAKVFVIDRSGERYEVRDVLPDYGGETGRILVRHVGPRSRVGDLEIDIHKAFGQMLPVVVYKPTRS